MSISFFKPQMLAVAFKKTLDVMKDISLPGPACTSVPPDAPFSSVPPLASPPADAPLTVVGCLHRSLAAVLHLVQKFVSIGDFKTGQRPVRATY